MINYNAILLCFMSFTFFCFMLVFINNNLAQSNFEEINKLVLKCSKGRGKSCEKLKSIALYDIFYVNRKFALQNILDQDFLIQIARNDKIDSIRIVALYNIKSQKILSEIILNDKSEKVILAAIDLLNDEQILGSISLNHNSLRIQQEALDKIHNQKILADICKNTNTKNGIAAIKKITDQNILAELTKHTYKNEYKIPFEERRNIAALEKITNEDILEDISYSDTRTEIRIAAVEKITNQSILKAIAYSDTYSEIRIKAINKIIDQSVLLDLVDVDSYTIKIAAIEALSDQEILEDLAKNGSISEQETAIKKLTNQNLLYELAMSDSHGAVNGINKVAAQTLTDQNLLHKLIKNADYNIKEEAIHNINDQSILYDIAKNEKNKLVQYFALGNLNVDDNYDKIIGIMNKNRYSNPNLSAIGALMIISENNILKKYYGDFSIHISLGTRTQQYIPYGHVTRFIYDIKIEGANYSKSFHFEGKSGAEEEWFSQSKWRLVNVGAIEMEDICSTLLSPLSNEDLLNISKESKVFYLRDTARGMLKK